MKFELDITSIKTGEIYQSEIVNDVDLKDFFSANAYFLEPFEGAKYIVIIDEDFGIRGYASPIVEAIDIIRGLIETDILALDIAEEEE